MQIKPTLLVSVVGAVSGWKQRQRQKYVRSSNELN